MSIYNAMGIILKWKKINDMFQIGILRNSSQNILVSWSVIFEGFQKLGVQMTLWRPAGSDYDQRTWLVTRGHWLLYFLCYLEVLRDGGRDGDEAVWSAAGYAPAGRAGRPSLPQYRYLLIGHLQLLP